MPCSICSFRRVLISLDLLIFMQAHNKTSSRCFFLPSLTWTLGKVQRGKKRNLLWGVLKWFLGVTSFGLCRTLENYVVLEFLWIVILRVKRTVPEHFLTYTEMMKPGWLVKLCDILQWCHQSHQTVVYACRFSFCEFSIWLLQMLSGYKWQWKGKGNTEVRSPLILLVSRYL